MSTKSQVVHPRHQERFKSSAICFFYFWVACLIVLVLVSSLTISGYSPLYMVQPRDCNATLYEDKPDWYTKTWTLDFKHGFCPKYAITEDYYRRLEVNQGQYQSDRGADTKTLIWNHCVGFHRSADSEWYLMDAQNVLMGYPTELANSQLLWYYAWQVGLAGTIIAWFILGLVLLSIPKVLTGLVGILLLIVSPFVFALLLASGATATSTWQTDPKAYSSYWFKSCNVDIIETNGFAMEGLAILCAAIIATILWVKASIYLCFECSEGACHHKDKHEDNKHTHEGRTVGGLHNAILGNHLDTIFGKPEVEYTPTNQEPDPEQPPVLPTEKPTIEEEQPAIKEEPGPLEEPIAETKSQKERSHNVVTVN